MKPTMELPDGKVKGNVDPELVLHSMVKNPPLFQSDHSFRLD
jgi:hypothetical protein